MQYSGMAVASVPLIMSESASGDLVLEHDNLKDLLGQPLIEELLGHAMQCGGEFAENYFLNIHEDSVWLSRKVRSVPRISGILLAPGYGLSREIAPDTRIPMISRGMRCSMPPP